MDNRLAFVSYSLATMAGICFISGLAIIASERGMQSGEIGIRSINN